MEDTGKRTETVWNESWRSMATGGGKSVLYPRPAWQNKVAHVIGENARGVPDISWNAAVNGGLQIYLTAYPKKQRSGWHVLGGTSAAAPQVAALTALINQFQTKNHAPPIGHLNPLLYSIKDNTAFNPVSPIKTTLLGSAQSGRVASNQRFVSNADGTVSPGPVPGFSSLVGWDMTTGFGSPNAPVFLDKVTRAKTEALNKQKEDNAVSGWHHPRDLRACGFHSQAGRLGAQAQNQSDTFSRRIRLEQQTPCAGDTGEAGQG